MKQLISREYTRQIKRKRQINVNSEVGGLETQKANHCISDWLLKYYVIGPVGAVSEIERKLIFPNSISRLNEPEVKCCSTDVGQLDIVFY